jgi:hypothetical protein
VKDLFVVRDCIFPHQDSFVGNITVTEKALAEHVKFLSDVAVFDEAFSPVLKCLFLWDFFI